MNIPSLSSFVLAGARFLDPAHEHPEIVAAISEVVAEERPLFRDDVDKHLTASLILAIAYREGSLGARVLGDCDVKTKDGACVSGPHSFCSMQVNDSVGGSDALNDDPVACIRVGLAILRTSVRVCASSPVAFYASGPRGCTNPRAQRISRDRVALAGRIRVAAEADVARQETASL